MAKRLAAYALLVILSLILIQSVTASVEIIPVDDEVLFGDRATFTIKIHNEESSSQTYTIKSLESGILWDVKTRRMLLLPCCLGLGEF